MSAYTGDIVKDGLLLCLDAANRKSFVSGSTTWYDISGNNITNTLTNGPSFNSSNRGSIVFDGTNDFVANTGYTPAVNTVSIWLNLASTQNGLIIGVGNNAYDSGQWSWSIFLYNGSFYLRGNPGGGGTTFPVTLNTWINWTMIRNNGSNSCLFYRNGEFMGSSGDSTLTNTYSGFRITGAGSVFASFSLSTVLLYNRALSAAEIRENYNATKGRYDTTRTSDAIKPRLSTNGLVLHLDAANYRSYISGSTTWRDLSGNGNNGTLTNGPTFSSANNGSIVFDGTNDFIQCTGTLSFSTATFLVWMYRNGTQGQWDGVLFSRGGAGGNVTGLGFFSSNQLGYHWNDNSNTYNWSSGLIVPDLQWSLCAVSVGATSATAYLCQQTGITSAVNNVSHASTTLSNLQIGQDSLGGRLFTGNIAVAQIYNRALSRDEIVQYFNYTKVRYGYTL